MRLKPISAKMTIWRQIIPRLRTLLLHGSLLFILGGTAVGNDGGLQLSPEPPAYVMEEMYRGGVPRDMLWIRAEYLRWWLKGNDLPPLVTTSPPLVGQDEAGVLGLGATVLYGDERVDRDDRGGVRAVIGHWLDEQRSIGLEFTWTSVFDTSDSGDYFISSPGSPTIARPFFDVNLLQNAAELTAFTAPDGTLIAAGAVNVDTSSELHSAAALVRAVYLEGSRGRIDLLGGYRYLRFREGLMIDEHVVSLDPGGIVGVGTTLDLRDRFDVENDFHGGELGIAAELTHDIFSLQLLGKVALGNMHQVRHISGSTVKYAPPPANTTATSPGGLLTQPTNIGTFENNEFAVLPEIGISAAVRLTRNLTLASGYSVLFVNHVARSGEQIDLGINSSQIGGNPLVGPHFRPEPVFADSDFWAQGLHIGLTFEL